MNKGKFRVCHMSSGHESYELRIFQKECSSLARKYDVTLIIPHLRREIANGVRMVPFKKYSSRLLRFTIAPIAMYREARRVSADVYHLHDPELIFTGILLKIFTNARVIYDVHEDHSGSLLSRGSRSFLSGVVARLFCAYEKSVAPIFDGVICVTPHIAAMFSGHKNLEIIYNYPLLNAFEKRSTEKDGSVVFFGNMSIERGILVICEAMKVLNERYGCDRRLKLVGQISPKSIEEQVLCKYRKYIEYTSWLDIYQAYDEVQKSIIGLVTYLPAPNHYYCMPNKLFEYMYFGMPVVCSNLPFMKMIVEKNECGLCVDPSSADDIASAIYRLLSDQELVRKMGENGRRLIENEINWRAMEGILFALYEGLLSGRSIS